MHELQAKRAIRQLENPLGRKINAAILPFNAITTLWLCFLSVSLLSRRHKS